jgi:protein N-terminal methyltransferase
MSLMPELCTVPSPLRALKPLPKTQRLRALDVGAGVGRVTSDTLLPLVDDVVLLEPVDIFILEALARGKASESEVEVNGASENTDANAELGNKGKWKGIPDKTKSVTFVKGTLQALDPARPDAAGEVLGRVGFPLPATSASASNKKDTEVSEVPEVLEMHSGFDVIWCQWCLGHLSDEDLVAFFKRAQKALRTRRIEEGEAASLIVVKENLCSEGEDGQPKTVYDEEDSSLTRCVSRSLTHGVCVGLDGCHSCGYAQIGSRVEEVVQRCGAYSCTGTDTGRIP